MFIKQKRGYFNAIDVIELLRRIRRFHLNDKVAIFFDNASYHRSNLVKEYSNSNDLRLVFNLPYKPEYNGIETMWAKWKQKFRKELTKLKL